MRTSENSNGAGGRPRDPGINDRILAATRDLLIRRGFAGTTMAAVAQAAGSGKAAVYRRWSSKTELVIAAVRALHESADAPETGSLRGDLLACALHYARADEHASRVMASLLSEFGREPELREAAAEAIGGPPAAAIAAALERWRVRGQIRDGAPNALLAEIIPAMAFHNVAVHRKPLDEAALTGIVDDVLLPALAPYLLAESGHEE